MSDAPERAWFNYIYDLTYAGRWPGLERTAAFLWHDFWAQVAICGLLADRVAAAEVAIGIELDRETQVKP